MGGGPLSVTKRRQKKTRRERTSGKPHKKTKTKKHNKTQKGRGNPPDQTTTTKDHQ
jgi:hypothetical protein